jgi:hypothetical protein
MNHGWQPCALRPEAASGLDSFQPQLLDSDMFSRPTVEPPILIEAVIAVVKGKHGLIELAIFALLWRHCSSFISPKLCPTQQSIRGQAYGNLDHGRSEKMPQFPGLAKANLEAHPPRRHDAAV